MSHSGRTLKRHYVLFQPSAYSQGVRTGQLPVFVRGVEWAEQSGYAGQFDASNAMEEIAAKTVEYAAKNTKVIGYSEALRLVPPHASFWLAPVYDVHAYFAAAYWLAVGALLTGNPALLHLAEENLSSGENRNYVFVQGMQGGVEDILNAAKAQLAQFPPAAPAYEAVARLSDPNFKRAQEETQWQQSGAGMAEGTLTGSGEDVAAAAEIGRGVFTGEKPQGMSDWQWFFTRYKWTLIGAGVASVALIAVGRPYAMAYYETVRTRREDKRRQADLEQMQAQMRTRSRSDEEG